MAQDQEAFADAMRRLSDALDEVLGAMTSLLEKLATPKEVGEQVGLGGGMVKTGLSSWYDQAGERWEIDPELIFQTDVRAQRNGHVVRGVEDLAEWLASVGEDASRWLEGQLLQAGREDQAETIRWLRRLTYREPIEEYSSR